MATKLSTKALERQWARALGATAEINRKLEDIQERKKWKEELKKEERSQAEGCEGEGSDKQDVLSYVPEGDVEGHNGVCDENERRKGSHPV